MRVRRGFVSDVYSEHGRSAVFVNNQVVVLSEIASHLLSLVQPGVEMGLPEITRAVVEEFGEPDPPVDASELVSRQLRDLVAHHVLWDTSGVPQGDFTPQSVSALRDALRHVISGDSARWRLPEGVAAPEFVAATLRHRVSPLVAASFDALDLPGDAVAQLDAESAQQRATVGDLSVGLAETFDALDDGGVPALAFKGLALASLAHGDVAARGMGDHDILVAPESVERAFRVLMGIGWQPLPGSTPPGDTFAWRHLIANHYELQMRTSSARLDLHWHLTTARGSLPSFHEAWTHRVELPIGGRQIPTLGRYHSMIHSAGHSAGDSWCWLRGLVDVRLLMASTKTWLEADRPLSPDQLMSVGLAARIFGVPAGAPPVVHEAVRKADAVWDLVVRQQCGPSIGAHTERMMPGMALLRTATSLRRAGGGAGDYAHMVATTLLPPHLLASETSRHGVVAAPRVLVRRIHEVVSLWLRVRNKTGHVT